MSAASFVAGDWGTSHLRLFLCDDHGAVRESVNGPGVAEVRRPFAEVFESLIESWESRHGPLPAVLCGMVGSSIGWTQAPYVSCPAVPAAIMDACVSLRGGRVQVVPGLKCQNRLGAPDVIRGEETQVLGALSLNPELRHGRQLLCLPGTHTKWLALRDGLIEEFLTAPAGELFGALRDHSVLVPKRPPNADSIGNVEFEAGVRRCMEHPHAPVLHLLFECRSRLLNGELNPESAAGFLSGLLIGTDVGGALHLFGGSIAERTVHVIGAHRLTQLYATALALRSHTPRQLDGAAASLAGLKHVHQHLSQMESHAV
jgi:2-dehydro-3-deoxygalactonokinase